MNIPQADPAIIARAKTWLTDSYDENTREEVQHLLDNDPAGLTDAFYQDLEFGTGGLRGIMGAGTNKMNIYTVGIATQGLCNYLKKAFPGTELKIAVAHDCRNNSRLFAEKTAEVCSANGIRVFLFEDLRPTPELSFAVRHLQCHAGIVVTASHNPKEYNGYKVYWNDGAQLVPPHDRNTIAEVRAIASPEEVKTTADPALITAIGAEIDNLYWDKVTALSLTDTGKKDLKIVYTSIHGTGINGVPQVLEKMGFSQVQLVIQQALTDGDFPTVHSPNPEEAAALDLAIQQAKYWDADLVLGTDPDADRVGIAVKDASGEMVLFNGNETAAVLVYYFLTCYAAQGRLKGNEFVAKTIVTTDLIKNIAAHFGVECMECLTGFKYIAELIRRYEGEKTYLIGGEESYGYLIGDFVRDKDAIASAAMIAECAAWAKAQGKTLVDILKEIHLQFGFYKETLISITKKGKAGAEEIKHMMADFRQNTPASINGSRVIATRDYQISKSNDLVSGAVTTIGMPVSDVFQFELEDGSIITARPSGTEPKIKFYVSVREQMTSEAEYEAKKTMLVGKIKGITTSLGLS